MTASVLKASLLRRGTFRTATFCAFAGVAAIVVLSASSRPGLAAPTPTINALHRFTGADGTSPRSALIQASDGNFYGTTASGGDDGSRCAQPCSGTVFKLNTNGALTNLWSFVGTSDAINPYTALVQGADGSFYGSAVNLQWIISKVKGHELSAQDVGG